MLVTGHTGFKGAWLCKMLLALGAKVTGYALPASAPSLYALSGIEPQIHSIIGDIRDLDGLKKAVALAQPELVFHLAAQALVQESYKNPVDTYSTNVMGTVHLLEAVRGCSSVRSVVNVTTDKVYCNNEWEWGYREEDALDGYDPYSNSKSCSELVTASYIRSFFAEGTVAISTARAGNVIGGGDFAPNRILPDCVHAVREGKPIAVHSPASVRPYQFVLEALRAYLLLAQRQYEDATLAGAYNIGPEESDCITTGALVQMFCEIWGNGAQWVDASKQHRVHEAGLLKLDSARIKSRLGFLPCGNIKSAMENTVAWYRAFLEKQELDQLMEKQIAAYMEDCRNV